MKFLILTLFLSLGACSTTTLTPPSTSDSFAMISVVSVGDSSQVSFSPQGDRFLYIGSNRFEHSHPQVYEYHFGSQKERRVTFQDGQVASPHYLSSTQIIYQSTTDYIKETLFEESLREKSSEKDLAFEIYISDFFGNSIERLTFNKIFDGNLKSFSRGDSRGVSYITGVPTDRKLILYRNDKSWSPSIRENILDAQVLGSHHALITLSKVEDHYQLQIQSLKNNKNLKTWIFKKLPKISTSLNEKLIFLLTSHPSDGRYQTLVQVLNWNEDCLVDWFQVPFQIEQIEERPGQLNQYLLVAKKKDRNQIFLKNMDLPKCEKSIPIQTGM